MVEELLGAGGEELLIEVMVYLPWVEEEGLEGRGGGGVDEVVAQRLCEGGGEGGTESGEVEAAAFKVYHLLHLLHYQHTLLTIFYSS